MEQRRRKNGLNVKKKGTYENNNNNNNNKKKKKKKKKKGKYEKIVGWLGFMVYFYGITFVGYLMSNPFLCE